MQKTLNLRKPFRSQGYALLITVVLLLALSMISIRFFSGVITDSKIAGYNRDSEEAFLLAESALNFLYGGFIYDADFNGDGKADNQVTINLETPIPFENHYMFIVSQSGSVEQTVPSILQRIADGEARAIDGEVNGAQISPSATTLLISNLFNDNAKPVIFIAGENGLEQKQGTWTDASTRNGKAAVWIEVIRDTFQTNRLYLFVQAAAQVGSSKSYIQRYIGEYSDTLGGNVWALTEANPNPGANN